MTKHWLNNNVYPTRCLPIYQLIPVKVYPNKQLLMREVMPEIGLYSHSNPNYIIIEFNVHELKKSCPDPTQVKRWLAWTLNIKMYLIPGLIFLFKLNIYRLDYDKTQHVENNYYIEMGKRKMIVYYYEIMNNAWFNFSILIFSRVMCFERTKAKSQHKHWLIITKLLVQQKQNKTDLTPPVLLRFSSFILIIFFFNNQTHAISLLIFQPSMV